MIEMLRYNWARNMVLSPRFGECMRGRIREGLRGMTWP